MQTQTANINNNFQDTAELFTKVFNERYIVTRSNNSRRNIAGNDDNIAERAAGFARWEGLTVTSIVKIKK